MIAFQEIQVARRHVHEHVAGLEREPREHRRVLVGRVTLRGGDDLRQVEHRRA
jgi:hypothetical protein